MVRPTRAWCSTSATECTVPEQLGLLEELLLIGPDLLDAVVLAAAAGDDGEVAERLHREQLAGEDLTNLTAHGRFKMSRRVALELQAPEDTDHHCQVR